LAECHLVLFWNRPGHDRNHLGFLSATYETSARVRRGYFTGPRGPLNRESLFFLELLLVSSNRYVTMIALEITSNPDTRGSGDGL
jgi:hypothetical protein